MNKTLRFSHKILLAVSLIVMLAFTLFTLYNDYLQRSATRTSLENYLAEMGESTSTNIRNLLEGRINLVKPGAERRQEPAKAETLMGESVLTSNFLIVYMGRADGSFSVRPDAKMPDGYDPRSALGTRTR
jgi:methyl-accepting chemotaxis protein